LQTYREAQLIHSHHVWCKALVHLFPLHLSLLLISFHREQDKEATVYIGNLDERVTDNLVWELMLQAGRIVNVHLPKDRVTQTHQGYGFVEFISEEDAEYAARVMNQVRLYGKPIRVNKASADKQKTVEVGAELFIGNLDPMVTEQVLYETFSRFGSLIAAPKVCQTPSFSRLGQLTTSPPDRSRR
jgi:splicing factor 3B subunit 4